MTYKKKSYKKFVATAASATLVASAIVPVVSAASFPDVEEKHEFATYINAAVDAGYIKGYADGTFGINDNLKRSQVVIIIGRYLEKLGYTSEATTSPWSDVKDEEVIKYGNIVKDAGVFTGYTDGTLNGGGFITRENMAVVLDRLAKTVTGTSLSDVAKDIEDVKIADLATANTDYQASIQALRDLEISTADNFNPKGNVKRGQFAKFIINAVEAIDAIAPTAESLAKEIAAVDATLPAVADITADNAAAAKAAVEAAKASIAAIEAKIDKAELTKEEVAELEKAIDAVEAKYAAIIEAADKAIEATKQFTVESVTAINATELQVTFNKAVDATSAKNADAYVITLNDKKYGTATGGLTYDGTVSSILDTVTTTPIHVSEDGKTVTFKLASTEYLAHGDKYSIDVKDSVLSKDGNSKVERYGDTQKVFSDLVAPTLVSTTLKGKDLELVFDEPVDIKGTNFGITVDGVDVTSQANVTTNPLDYTVTVALNSTTQAALLNPGNHDVTVFNARDFVVNNANIGNRAPILTGSYKVSGEVTIPAVAELEAIDFNSFDVEFNKVVTDGRIIVKRGNTVFYDQTFTGGTTDTQTIALPVSAISPSAGLTWLYDTNATSTQVTVEVVDYKDGSSLFGSKYTSTLTLKRDDVKPTAVSSAINTGETGFDVQLNRASELAAGSVKVTAGQLDVNKIKVTDKNGVVRTLTSAAIDATGKVSVVLNGFDGTTVKASDFAPFKVEFAAGTVEYETDKIKVVSPKDNAGNNFALTDYTNKLANAAFTTNVATTNSAYKAVEGVASVGISENVITVTYKETVDSSATKLENYTLDGKALPTGSTITLDGTNKIVTIVLPKETYAAQQKRALGVSTNVKTVAGEYIVGNIGTKEAYLSELLTIEDNTKPVLVSAKFLNVATDNTTNEIELTFSENVTVTANNTNFVVIAHDGTEIKATATAVVAADNSKVVKLTLDGTAKVNTLQTVKVKVAEKSATNATLVVDNTGLTIKNEVVTGTIVTVTK